MRKIIVLFGITAFLVTGCATGGPQTKTGKGAVYGTAGGAAAGAAIGQAIGRDRQGTLLGAAIGAAVGGLAGAGIGKMMDQQEAEMNEALASSDAASVSREGDLLAITLKGDVAFDTNSAVVKPTLTSEIDRIAGIMVKYADTAIVVEGHTDNKGEDAYNMKLSQQRANSVSNLLVNRGVITSRIKTVAYGESQPVADNNSAEGRQKNRRVEIKVEPTQQAAQ